MTTCRRPGLRGILAVASCCVVAILTLGLPLEVDAQGCNWRAALESEPASNARRIQAIDEEAELLHQKWSEVLKAQKTHDGGPPDPRNVPAVNAYNREADQLDAKKERLESRLKILEVEQDRLLARNREIEENIKVCQEQKEESLKKIDAELAALDQRNARTRTALEKYSTRFEGYQASLEEWTRLPLEARERAQLAAKDTVAEIFLGQLGHKKAQVLSQEAKLQLSSNRFWQNLRGARLGQIAKAQKDFWGKIRSAKTDVAVITALSVFKDSLGAAPALELKDKEEALTAVLKSIAIVNAATIRNPVIGLLISGGELAIADVYAYVGGALARERVEQLLLVGESELKGLKALTERYKADIDRRNDLLFKRETVLAQ